MGQGHLLQREHVKRLDPPHVHHGEVELLAHFQGFIQERAKCQQSNALALPANLRCRPCQRLEVALHLGEQAQLALVSLNARDDFEEDALEALGVVIAARASRAADPADHVILPEVISKEPLGPAVRQGDDQWFNLVKWTLYSLINAEELGVTKANVDEQLASTNPDVKRLLGKEGDGTALCGCNPVPQGAL